MATLILLSVAQPPARSTKTGMNSYKRGEQSPKTTKIPLGIQTRWKPRGFTRSADPILTKKETALQLSLMVREAGLEPARPQ